MTRDGIRPHLAVIDEHEQVPVPAVVWTPEEARELMRVLNGQGVPARPIRPVQ